MPIREWSTVLKLYELDKQKQVIDSFDQTVKVTAEFDIATALINFGGSVTYDLDAFILCDEEWFCLDAKGFSYSRQPNGVYVKLSDVWWFTDQIRS